MSTEVSKSIDVALYPELAAAGGLGPAIQQALDEGSGRLRARDLDMPGFLVQASVKLGTRSSQVMIAARERAFSVDFWSEGVRYGQMWCHDLSKVAVAISSFLEARSSLTDMRALFPEFDLDVRATAHEAGADAFVALAWQDLVRRLRWEPQGTPLGRLFPLVEAAGARPELRRLMPFTSMDSLHLSRVTGFPYTRDCPNGVPVRDGRFRVTLGDRFLGEADAEGSAGTIAIYLPEGCGPAKHGTADPE